MKSFIQGIFTGGVLVFSFMVLSASSQQEPTCDLNLEMIKLNAKQIESIWGAIETTMDLQNIQYDGYRKTDEILTKDIDILKAKINQLTIIIEEYY